MVALFEDRSRFPAVRRALALLVAAVAAAGCFAPAADGGPHPGARAPDDGPLECPPLASRALARPLRAHGDAAPTGQAPGTVALTAGRALAWAWQDVRAGEAADELLRLGDFTLHQDATGTHWVCGRVNLAVPDEPAPSDAPATLKVVIAGEDPLPAGNYTLVMRWDLARPGLLPLTGNSTASLGIP